MLQMAICSFLYVALYLFFGYFVAWQNPALRAFYGGGELKGFFELISTAPVATKVIPLQFARGLAWTLLCMLMIRNMNGNRFVKAIIIACVLSIVMNAQLLIPNPIMSRDIRIAHLVETASSNFLFGMIAVIVLTTRFRRG